MKKAVKVVGCTLLSGLLLAGCGNNKQASTEKKSGNDEVKLVFWDENAGPQRTPVWEKLLADFEKENPNITVEYVGLPKDEAKSKMDAAIAANDTPDVASLQSSWLPEFSIRETLLPLDKYYEQSEIKDSINKGAIDFNKEIVRDHKIYGIPYTQNLDILWIRNDLFEENKVTRPNNWDNFFSAADKMTYDNMYGYTIRGGAGGSLQLQRLMYAYSGIDHYLDENGKCTINDPIHVEFVEKYFDMYDKNTPHSDITNGYKEMVAGFDTGVVAMLHHNIGSYGEHSKALKKNQFEAVPLPLSEEDNYVVEGGNTIGISIFKNTQYPEESWKLTEFLNEATSQSYWNENIGQIPTNSEVLQDDWIKDSQHIKVAFDVYDDKKTKLYQPPFYLPDYRSILDNQVDPGIQSVMTGKKTAKEFLDSWAKAIEDSNVKYNKAMKNK